MTNDIRVVVDTNVLVSGLFGIKGSPSSQVLSAIRTQKIILVTSPVILEEIVEVINRERIVKLTKMSTGERADFINKLIERSDVTAGKQLLRKFGRDISRASLPLSRDVKDDKFLACGFEAKADYIVTGDNDLLVLKVYEGIRIITPRELLAILNKK